MERLPGGFAKVDICGLRREVNLALVEPVVVGQWVLIHVGFAMSVLDEAEARGTLDALQNMFEVEPDVGALLHGEGFD